MWLIKGIIVGMALLLTACAPKPSINNVPSTEKAQKLATESDSHHKDSLAKNAPLKKTTVEDDQPNLKQDNKEAHHAKSGPAGSAKSISSWEIFGAMAAHSKNKGWNASVNWLQRGFSYYQIRLFGPIGSGTIIITKNGSTVSYKDGPKSATSTNAEELLAKQTGIRLPVNNLYYWVRGLPAPGSVQHIKRDANNQTRLLQQSGYTIEYAQYVNVGKVSLPSKIRLSGRGVSIKLFIKRWKI